VSGITDFLLKIAGVPEDVIAQIDTVTPSVTNLVALEEKLAPIFATPQTLAQHLTAATPLLQAAVPDILAVLPLIKSLSTLAVAKG